MEVVVPLLQRVVGISHATDVELSGLSLRHSDVSCPSAARNRSEILTLHLEGNLNLLSEV